MRRVRKKSRRLSEREKWEQSVAQSIAEREAEIAERERERLHTEALYEEKIEDRLFGLRIDHEARKRLNAELVRSREATLPNVGYTLEEFLEEDDSLPETVIEELHYRGSNTLLVAEYKTGKTTLEINLARALADGEPFLGRFGVNMPFGRIAFLNYEMSDSQFRHWCREAGIVNRDRVLPLNLRGHQLPFWEEETMLRTAEWLLENHVGFIILDPASKAWRGLVESEADNIQLAEFFGSLDELKRLADVSNLLIATHKPRGNEDRARGGGEIEAWPDAMWYLNKRKDGMRTLRAMGRDVELAATELEWNEESRLLTAGKTWTSEKVKVDGVERVLSALKQYGEFPSTSTLCEAMTGKNELKREWINEAVKKGLVEMTKNGQSRTYKLAES